MPTKAQERALQEISKFFPLSNHTYQTMPYADLFAIGCSFLAKGKEIPGNKALITALQAVDASPEQIRRILDVAQAFPKEALQQSNCHVEFSDSY